MSVVAVHDYDNLYTKRLFSELNPDRIFSDVYTDVIANVHVESASFEEEYRGPELLHKPYMKMSGTVDSVFLSDSDDRLFPCGAKHLQLMESVNVTVSYYLSVQELTYLTSIGLFSEYGDFDVPMNLVGNNIEIPVIVSYFGYENSPLGAVSVMYADELRTCTRDNYYYDLFTEGCKESVLITEEQKQGYQFYEPYPIYQSEEEIEDAYGQPAPEMDTEKTGEDQKDGEKNVQRSQYEVMEDEHNKDAVRRLIADDAAKRKELMVAASQATPEDILRRANAYVEERRMEISDQRESSLSDAIFGTEGEDIRNDIDEHMTYDDIKRATETVVQEKFEADADVVKENARQVDVAHDNQLMNEGIDDIAGGASSMSDPERNNAGSSDSQGDGSFDFDEQPESDTVVPMVASSGVMSEQERAVVEEKSGAKTQEQFRKVDVGEDLKAKNEYGFGVDTSGQGVQMSAIEFLKARQNGSMVNVPEAQPASVQQLRTSQPAQPVPEEPPIQSVPEQFSSVAEQTPSDTGTVKEHHVPSTAELLAMADEGDTYNWNASPDSSSAQPSSVNDEPQYL